MCLGMGMSGAAREFPVSPGTANDAFQRKEASMEKPRDASPLFWCGPLQIGVVAANGSGRRFLMGSKYGHSPAQGGVRNFRGPFCGFNRGNMAYHFRLELNAGKGENEEVALRRFHGLLLEGDGRVGNIATDV